MSEQQPQGNAKIVVVDDHLMVLEAMCRLIDDQPDLDVVGRATTSAGALEEVERRDPDLLVLDLALGDDGGLELIRRLHRDDPGLPILIMSMYDEEVFAERALRAGALGYVMKEEAVDVLIDAIHEGLRGQVHLSPRLRDRAIRRVAGRGDGDWTTIPELTDREVEVFRLIGEGLSTREIADRLRLSAKTIETHRAKIMRKLDLESSFHLTHRAIAWLHHVAGSP